MIALGLSSTTIRPSCDHNARQPHNSAKRSTNTATICLISRRENPACATWTADWQTAQVSKRLGLDSSAD